MAAVPELRDTPGHLLRRAHQTHNAVWTEVVGGELTSVQFALLTAVATTEGADQRRIADHIGSDRSTIADMALRLERRGLLDQRRDPDDGRRRILALTPAGQELHDRLLPLVAEVQTRLLEGFSADERASLVALLTRIGDHDLQG